MKGNGSDCKIVQSDFDVAVNGDFRGEDLRGGHFHGYLNDHSKKSIENELEMTKVYTLDHESDAVDARKGSVSDPDAESRSTCDTREDEGKKAKKMVSFSQLWRYATTTERIIYGFSCFCSVVVGSALPSFSLLYGRLINIVSDFVFDCFCDSS